MAMYVCVLVIGDNICVIVSICAHEVWENV